jgi:hypothetical protein
MLDIFQSGASANLAREAPTPADPGKDPTIASFSAAAGEGGAPDAERLAPRSPHNFAPREVGRDLVDHNCWKSSNSMRKKPKKTTETTGEKHGRKD